MTSVSVLLFCNVAKANEVPGDKTKQMIKKLKDVSKIRH